MKIKIPGIILCFFIAGIAQLIGQISPLLGGPISAIALGALLNHYLKLPKSLLPGIRFSARTILQLAIVLLGFGLNLSVIAKTGWDSLPIILVTVSAALIVAAILRRVWKMEPKTAQLIGVGSAICGGSAIAATAPIIQADDDQVAQSISVIFFYNLLAAILFPLLGNWLGFSPDSGEAFGLFAGTAVNDTSSVTAAAAAWDNMHQLGTATLDYAVTVKLTRTLFIIPIALGLSLLSAKEGPRKAWYQHIPHFLLYFLAASIISSLVSLLGYQLPGVAYIKDASKFLIVMAMAGIGLGTKLRELIRSGWKPLLLGFALWLTVSLTSLISQYLLGLW